MGARPWCPGISLRGPCQQPALPNHTASASPRAVGPHLGYAEGFAGQAGGAVGRPVDDLDRQLWEIDENLCRAELTEIARGEHLKRRKEIFDAKGAQKLTTPGGMQEIGFDKDKRSPAEAGPVQHRVSRLLTRRPRAVGPHLGYAEGFFP